MKKAFYRFGIELLCLFLAMCNLHFLAERIPAGLACFAAVWVYCIVLICLIIAYMAFFESKNTAYDVINFIFISCFRSIFVVMVTYGYMSAFTGLLNYALFLFVGSFLLSLTKTHIKQFTY